jgi:hypothetical protein
LATFLPLVSLDQAYPEKKYRSAKGNETDGGSCPGEAIRFLSLLFAALRSQQ